MEYRKLGNSGLKISELSFGSWVIANRAHQLAGKTIGEGEKTIQPNDDVNKSQSSNDTFPTGMHIAGYKKIIEVTIPGGRGRTHTRLFGWTAA